VSIADAFASFPRAPGELAAVVPPTELVLAPGDVEETAAILETASDLRARVLVWGGGTHQGIGHRVEPDVVISTAALDRIVAWEPDDLTLVVEGGVTVAAVEAMLAERGQTAALPEWGGPATVGGVVAAAISGYRRHRYGPTRDRLLEATIVTGDGRVVRGGGRVVKNVTGYDIPRLVAGSFGSLGVIVSVCFKLWPLAERRATVTVDDAERALQTLFRPVAVLETRDGVSVYLAGTEAEVQSEAERVDGVATEGFAWPDPPQGETVWSLRVPPALVSEGIGRLPADWVFVAEHGVGHLRCAGRFDAAAVAELRGWAEEAGGALVLEHAEDQSVYERLDPWGTPPSGMALQRRLMAAFDPAHILAPGRLPGGR